MASPEAGGAVVRCGVIGLRPRRQSGQQKQWDDSETLHGGNLARAVAGRKMYQIVFGADRVASA
jgi:hypothetical protein